MMHLNELNDQENMRTLLLEDICSDLVRFLHSKGDPTRFGVVRIDREWALGTDGSFADLRVEPEDEPPYFLEVKYGYDSQTLLTRLQHKYGQPGAANSSENRLVLVVDTVAHPDWPALQAVIQSVLAPSLRLEVWDDDRLHELICDCFGQTVPSFEGPELLAIREILDLGKERLAFGDDPPGSYRETVLRQNLMWHFGTWRLRELRHTHGMEEPMQLVPPGMYEQVAVMIADLSSFSRYVHDTPDDFTVRQILTSFYAKSRYQVINAGGMLLQFIGDSVVALFGIPDQRPGYLKAAMHTANRLLDIGASVSHAWQRRIDHVQMHHGAHIAMAIGRVHLVAMRSLDHARLAAAGDCLAIATRLLPLAGSGEIVVSNVLRHALQHTSYEFESLEPTEVKNLGTLQPWRLIREKGKGERGKG